MKKKSTFFALCALIVLSGLILTACQPAVPAENTAPAQAAALKIAVLPVLDALPMYVAQSEGLFAKHGVQVEFIPVASAPERDSLVVSGQADGMINEALSTALYNKDQVQVQTVRYARAATAENALFSILAAKDSGIATPSDLKGVPVGISEGTVIAYLTDRLLEGEGFAKEDIATIAVPKIPDRINLLASGELKAGMLPEPATSMAKQQGAVVIVDDTAHPEYSFSTITFRKAVIDERPEAVRSFLAAIEDATALINADPGKFANLLVEMKVLPPPLADKFIVPPFVTAGVPTPAQWMDMNDWALEKGLLDAPVDYTSSVNAGFLP